MAGKLAVYAGTFDPPTVGHIWMIERGAELFDNLIVAIGENPEKKCLFGLDERLTMLRHVTRHLPNVSVTHYLNRFLVRFAEAVGAKFILRGIRSTPDYEYEKVMRHINADMNSGIHTIFLEPPRDISEVSSSMVKGLVGPDGWERIVCRYTDPFVFEKIELMHLKRTLENRWMSLWTRIGAKGDPKKYFDEIVRAYTQPHRFYHTLAHLAHCFKELDSWLASGRHISFAVDLELALWYHDFVYDPKAQDNEDKSAEAAEIFCTEVGLAGFVIAPTVRHIRATKHSEENPPMNEWFMIDIDLAILGQSEDVFDKYEEDIRKEYAHVKEDDFRKGRTAILNKFLARERIYRTDFFHAKYEARARENLKRSLKKLAAKK